MRYIDRMPHRGIILWLGIALYSLAVTQHRLSWAFVLVTAYLLARDGHELLVNLVAGWVGIALGCYFTLLKEVPPK